MKQIRSITQARGLKDKRVLVRLDLNVPLKNGRVADDARIAASLPTIRYLIGKKAKVILLSHLGRPEGKAVRSLSLAPVAKRLGDMLERPVAHIGAYAGPRAMAAIDAMRGGDVILLENIRFSPDESGNKGQFARHLAVLGDLFVFDGFAVAHRDDASVSGIPQYLPSYAGLLLKAELDGLKKLTGRPAHPFVAIIGGAKMETKIPMMGALLPKADAMLVGGGIVNTVLKARGYDVGASLADDTVLGIARSYAKEKNIIFPIDVVVGTRTGHTGRQVRIGPNPHPICRKGEMILDIGPETIRRYAAIIKSARTILWNGAMGYFERKPFDTGTLSVARLVAARSKGKAFGVIGGGETVQSMDMTGMSDDVDMISTGGGAMLALLAGEKLLGIEALKR
jgi:phosphoglycerate kinase